ncbi:MAG: DUF1648 domain-containing protein [Lachnospiraceae bacterium]|nr:DUF1648 domain-containing protein [Lachnospiraceae bacterium]
MIRREKLQLKYTRTALVLEILSWLLVVALLIVTLNLYSKLGDTIPTKFSPDGTVLAYGPRESAVAGVVIAVIVYIIITGIGVVIRRSAPPDTPCPRLSAALTCLLALKALFLAWEIGSTYCRLSCIRIWPALTPAAIGAGAAVIAFTVFFILKLSRAADNS